MPKTRHSAVTITALSSACYITGTKPKRTGSETDRSRPTSRKGRRRRRRRTSDAFRAQPGRKQEERPADDDDDDDNGTKRSRQQHQVRSKYINIYILRHINPHSHGRPNRPYLGQRAGRRDYMQATVG